MPQNTPKPKEKPRKRRYYHRLTETDWLNIEKWRRKKATPKEIAARLRVNIFTACREPKHGTYKRLDGAAWKIEEAYGLEIEQKKYEDNLRAKGPQLKIGNDHEYANWLEKTIAEKDCSPAALESYAHQKKKHFPTKASTPTIYRYTCRRDRNEEILRV